MAKQNAGKKTVRVKAVSVKSPTGISAEKKELTGLLDQLEKNDLIWLITQVKTIIYNRKVAEVNEAARDLAESRQRAGTPKTRAAQVDSAPAVDIVQAGGPKNFNIVMGNARLFLNLPELKALVKIAGSAGDSGDGAGRLYRWFQKERQDIIIDGGITGPADPRLRVVHNILRERFTVG